MSKLVSQIQTIWWYLRNPSFLPQAFRIVKRKFSNNSKEDSKHEATERCKLLAISTEAAIQRLFAEVSVLHFKDLFPDLYNSAEKKQLESPYKMGGAGNLTLLYHICESLGARNVIETGVAYGWSSLAILQSLRNREGKLISTDMPYAKMGNENHVGIVLPEELKSYWHLIQLPDRTGLPKAISLMNGPLDLCHYDSDKSYDGRMFAYPLLWKALRSEGLFVSDDIGDNMGFFDFATQVGRMPIVVEWEKKYIGILRR